MHVYLHVPFCARRCSYCDFAIAVRRATPDAAYVTAIAQEWHRWMAEHALRGPIDTVYFGGGTPSRLQPASIDAMLRMLAADSTIAPDAEVTLEANPDDVTPDRAVAWANAGINRISLGVQSHSAAVLEWMHRTHRAEQVEPAVAAIRAAGITNISLDLIFALPEQLERDWQDDLQRTIALEPTHISLYGLTVEPQTPLQRWVDRGVTTTVPDDRYALEYLAANAALVAAGFEHYEVSNAGRPGFRARHNSVYWRGTEYVGLGPSAHSLIGGVRRWNVREWADYHQRLLQGESIVGGDETIDAGARTLENRYLGLRTSEGLPVDQLSEATREAWRRSGWAVVRSGRLSLTPEGWLRLDALVTAD